MKIKIENARELCECILVKNGVPRKEAEIIVDEYIESELQGKRSHGLMAFPTLVERMKALKVSRTKSTIRRESSAVAIIDGNHCFGQLVGREAVEMVCKKAKREGIGFAAISNFIGFLRPGTFAKMIADRKMVGVVVNDGGSRLLAPPGAIDPVLGTNPIGIGIPTDDDPILADMATSKRSWTEVRVARMLRRPLEENTYMDKKGSFTIKPEEAHSVVPMAGPKGFAIALLIEILTKSLLNMPVGVRSEDPNRRPSMRGAIFMAIDPSFYTDSWQFRRRNSDLVQQIKSCRKLKQTQSILIPGDRSRKRREESLKKGYLDVEQEVIEGIRKLLQ